MKRKNDFKMFENVLYEGEKATIIDLLDEYADNILIELENLDIDEEFSTIEVPYYFLKKIK